MKGGVSDGPSPGQGPGGDGPADSQQAQAGGSSEAASDRPGHGWAGLPGNPASSDGPAAADWPVQHGPEGARVAPQYPPASARPGDRGHDRPAGDPPSEAPAQQPPAFGTGAAVGAAATVPRQKDGTPRLRPGWTGAVGPEPAALPDLLDHPDPAVAAEAATVENLLRCWVREAAIPRPDGPAGTLLRIPLPASGAALLVAVRYWSPAGWHRFAPARLEGAPAGAPALDAVTLAALIAREGTGGGRGGADLVGRVSDSVRRTTEFIADRRQRPTAPAPVAGDRFLTAEQSLLLGHPLQPDPKSREGLSEAEVRGYSPELHGSFPLHWFAVAPTALATDSAWTERGRPVPAAQLLGRLAPGLPLPDGTVPLPLHPWQARDLLQRPAVAGLRDAGLLHDLGPHGDPWYPTSSVRTVHRPGAPAMLKLSLGLRITNSRRENLRKELHRGVEVHRLLRTGLAEQWQTSHPRFDIVRDPAWVAVDAQDGTPVPGLDVMLRHNPFRSGDDAVCVAALTAPRPWPGRTTMRSRLAEIVCSLATATGHTPSAVAAEWFLRYLDHVVLPVLAFDALAGIALEAHQQNILVLLDPAGWPVGGRYRDNQGYYFRESRRAELEHRLPGIGSASDTFVSDAVTDERFAYYLGINNVLGLIGAFGSQRLADERVLLAAFRRFLSKAAGLGPLPTRLLDSPTLRCKANLLTRLGGLDELVGPVDTQSVYVTIANPLHD
ncbi:IucA/IucC family protein [Streptomyces xanthophaeus]|uniref:IucA/IucC family protein n=1 Tax=Streptomyces xanthophaeus TaxID=67385 RepID=UPI00398F96C4